MIPINIQWIFDHWDQITISITLIVYLISSIAVGLKEQPLNGEGRIHFLWRVAGIVAFVTFKNLYGTWKMPMANQPWPGTAPIPIKPVDEGSENSGIPVGSIVRPRPPASLPREARRSDWQDPQ